VPDDQQLTELRSEARDEKDKVVQELDKAKIVAEPERAHGQPEYRWKCSHVFLGRFYGMPWGRVGIARLNAFTRILRAFKSVVHVRANERTAALVAL
jgi:hypothetical protein